MTTQSSDQRLRWWSNCLSMMGLVFGLLLLLGLVWVDPFFLGQQRGLYWFLLTYTGQGALLFEAALVAVGAGLTIVQIRKKQRGLVTGPTIPRMARVTIAIAFVGFCANFFNLVFLKRVTDQHVVLARHHYYLTLETSISNEPRYYLFQCDQFGLLCQRVWLGYGYPGSDRDNPIVSVDHVRQTIQVTQGNVAVYNSALENDPD